jgi:predicted ATPase
MTLDQFEEARRRIEEAMEAAETTKERWYEAEIYRIAGHVTLLSSAPDVAKVEEHFHHALAISREQQAKSWELRAAMSLGGLWQGQGRQKEAYELLAPVFNWFTEGFGTLDLKEAKVFLDERSPTEPRPLPPSATIKPTL